MIRSLSLSVPFEEGFTIPDTVLTGETPHLRRLKLHRVNINWNSRFLRDLTHLNIHRVANLARPTTDQFINALQRMPALEVLNIQDALPLASHGPSTDRIVDLPHLALLSVASTVPECANLVSLLTIPAKARVHLICSGTETTGADFSGVMRVISNPGGTTYHQEKAGRESIEILHVRYEAPISLVVDGWTNVITSDPRINVPDIQLRFSWPDSPLTTVDSVVASVCGTIPMTSLRSLRIAYVDGTSPRIWIDTFGHLLKLHSVHIVGRPARAFVSALREEAPAEAVTNPLLTPEGLLEVSQPGLCQRHSAVPSVYFPQLRSLTMEKVSFDEEDTSQTTLTIYDLQSCLIERSQRQAKIQKLCLQKCSHLGADTVQTLRAFVSVDWEGIFDGLGNGFELENGFELGNGYELEGLYDEVGDDFLGGYGVPDEEMDLDTMLAALTI
ncbi:hypothetical protein C0992_007848 [Termitomyces sp. T32_za158]|nr:hypothetical protein C0992_007848 [Termitomyces sp. T32_za158]